jgi:hypothetical protein
VASEPQVGVDRFLQRPREELAAGVVDQDGGPDVAQVRLGEVDPAEPRPPLTSGAGCVAGRDLGATAGALGTGSPGGPALEALLVLLADRLGVAGEVTAQPVGERG